MDQDHTFLLLTLDNLIMRLASWSLLMCSVTYALSPSCSSRRSFVVSTIGIWGLGAPAVNALQERNDALCGTGFFTNIWQYKCTVVGDIEDEGTPKDFSAEEKDTVDSLLSKFNLDIDKATKVVETSLHDPKDSSHQQQ